MCGVAGYIGQSRKPKLTYDLITNLFDYLELRGTDAAGVWGTECGDTGRIIYHKEPIRSAQFIQTEFWQQLRNVKLDMMLVHARAASKGGGLPIINSNNHPFVSDDRKIGMVHNGSIDEAYFLKTKYEALSSTDSEYLLRIYEHGLDREPDKILKVPKDVLRKLTGVKDIYSYVSQGAMAVAIGEKSDENVRSLLLFRNDKRPLWLADLRTLLGQIFFFSSPDIWYRSLTNSPNIKKLCWGTQKLFELPANQFWCMQIKEGAPIVVDRNLYKFSINATFSSKEFDSSDFCHVKKSESKAQLLSKLDDNDEIVKPKVIVNSMFKPQEIEEEELDYDPLHIKKNDPEDEPPEPPEEPELDPEDFDPFGREDEEVDTWGDHTVICEEIKTLTDGINVATSNARLEGSIEVGDHQCLLESLEQIKCDLEGTLKLIQG